MKLKHIINVFIGLTFVWISTSCESYLDKLPDNRANLNSEDNITDLLVSAYPTVAICMLGEASSDNIKDNGINYGTLNQVVEEYYRWQPSTQKIADSPTHLWEGYYGAIAVANQALEAIDLSDNPDELNAQRGEALLCRAYSHFMLVNIFCQAYNEQTSDKDLGIPYVKERETIVSKNYDRGTVKLVYEDIAQDIEEGIGLINDELYSIPKYHFNTKAANAFAARFYLYYRKYDKVIEYASKVLGSSLANMLRDYSPYPSLSSYFEIGNQYIKAEENSNLLLQTAVSAYARMTGVYKTYRRYGHPIAKMLETLLSAGIWGNERSLKYFDKLFGTQEYGLVFPKQIEFFEYTDKVAGIGQAHIVTTAFTTDELLLCRAEAYIYQKEYTQAVADIQAWFDTHASGVTVSRSAVNQYYGSQATEKTKKELHPKFTIENGEQLNFVNCILHLRRIETIHEGLRWFDIKRYGIEVTHNISGSSDDILTVDDPRRAIQIPTDVIGAGLTPNPR